MSQETSQRRDFLVKSAAAMFTTNIFTGQVRGANDKISAAFIGMGRMGRTNLQAAMGVAQYERLPQALARKRQIGARYNELLAPVANIRLPSQREWARANYWMYAIVLGDEVEADASEFATLLKQEGIDTRPFFLGMHEQPVLRARGLFEGLRLPVTERLSRRGLYLPSGLTLSDEQIGTVAGAIKEILA